MYAADAANPSIVSAQAASRPAPAWLLLIIAIAFAVAEVWLTVRLWRLISPSVAAPLAGLGPWGQLLSAALFNLLVFAPLLAAALVGCAVEGRRLWARGARQGAYAALGLLLGAGGFGVALGLAALAGVVVPGHESVAGAPTLIALTGGVLVIGFQSAAEEIYFRGWLQPVLCARWGAWPGLIAGALAFSALHMVAGARSPMAVANLFLGGLVFGLLALRSGGLWAPILAHFGWNWLEACGVGLEPNPGVGPTGALANLDLAGARLWSGGADDMNGSLAAILVLAALALGLLVLPPIRPAAPEARRSGSAP